MRFANLLFCGLHVVTALMQHQHRHLSRLVLHELDFRLENLGKKTVLDSASSLNFDSPVICASRFPPSIVITRMNFGFNA